MNNILDIINETFNNFINFLQTEYSNTTLNVLIGFLIITGIIFALRIIVASGYQMQYFIFKNRSKKILNKELDVFEEKKEELIVTPEEEKKSKKEERKLKRQEKKESRFGMIGKVMNDYRTAVSKGVKKIDTRAIVQKRIYRLSFLGWSYDSIERFISSIENNIVFIGIIVTLALPEKELFSIMSISLFFTIKILSNIFDFNIIKDRLIVEMIEFVDNEFAEETEDGNITEIISNLRKEMVYAINKQGQVIKTSMDTFGENITGSLSLSIKEMKMSVEESVLKASQFAKDLDKPIEKWAETIDNASYVQEKINISFDRLKLVLDNITEASSSLENNYSSYFNKITEQTETLKENIYILNNSIGSLKENNTKTKKDYEIISKELEFVELNQVTLKKSLEKYELSLENITSKMGEAFGNIMDLQMQTSYTNLNEEMQNNLNQIILSNSDVLGSMEDLFTTMQEQTKAQTQMMLQVKNQIEKNEKSEQHLDILDELNL